MGTVIFEDVDELDFEMIAASLRSQLDKPYMQIMEDMGRDDLTEEQKTDRRERAEQDIAWIDHLLSKIDYKKE